MAEAALKLMGSQGFEETTIDQIAAVAGVSRRTFFRYFPSKEDVIIESVDEMGALLPERVRSRPPAEPPLAALRAALDIFVETYAVHGAKALRVVTTTLASPALMARYLERQTHWKADVTVELAARMRVDAEDLRPALAVAVAFAAFDAAVTSWAHSDGAQDLNALADRAFALVAAPLD